MLNIEQTLITYLNDSLDAPTFADVPSSRPAQFITVERAGGAVDFYRDQASIIVQCWGSSRFEASELGNQTIDKLIDFIAVDGIMKVNINGFYNFPDPDSKQARYQITANIITT